MSRETLSWFGIARLGLVQAALGSIVVLATSVMNRVMIVELALPAVIPGALIALHYALQLLRPKFGHGSDRGGRRTPWILGGMLLLAGGAILAASAIGLARSHDVMGLLLAVLAFTSIGLGVGACGTSVLTLLADRCEARRRPVAATVVWLMMIAGFVVTTIVTGRFLDPFTFGKLIQATATVAGVAMIVTLCAVWRLEAAGTPTLAEPSGAAATQSYATALRQVWAEPQARQFAIFIFVSMLGYSSEELILDPFSAFAFGYTPGQSTQLSGSLHAGVFCGMLLVAFAASLPRRFRFPVLQSWMVIGCMASALSLASLAGLATHVLVLPLRPLVLLLGFANGMFAVAAIGSMMQFANLGPHGRQGTRMGVWGAAQGIAFGLGGVLASGTVDVARSLLDSPALSYGLVFCGEALLFGFAARIAFCLNRQPGRVSRMPVGRHLSMVTMKADL
jgi:BCD family chlorophyll transporter-like MFS transporter